MRKRDMKTFLVILASLAMTMVALALFASQSNAAAAEAESTTVYESALSGTNNTPTSASPDSAGVRLLTHWEFTVVRHGRVLDSWEQHNLVTTEGLGHILSVVFDAESGQTPWYVGLYDNSITPVIGDSYESNNMSECTAYTADGSGAKTRPVWDGIEGSGATVFTNTADLAQFDIVLASGTTEIYGAFLCSSGVSGDATSGNTLFSLANFSSSRSLVNGDTLYVTIQYELDTD